MLPMIAPALLLAQAISASPSTPVDEGIAKARAFVLDQLVLKVFRARNGQFYSCFAYKLAEGEPDDAAQPTGSGMAVGVFEGHARGFKLYIKDRDEKYEYGLFGREFYVGSVALEAKGKAWFAIYSFGDLKLPELLSLDGEQAEVEIATYRYQSRIGPSDRYSGYIDLQGLRAAHAALAKCHQGKEPL